MYGCVWLVYYLCNTYFVGNTTIVLIFVKRLYLSVIVLFLFYSQILVLPIIYHLYLTICFFAVYKHRLINTTQTRESKDLNWMVVKMFIFFFRFVWLYNDEKWKTIIASVILKEYLLNWFRIFFFYSDEKVVKCLIFVVDNKF